jgi:plasmid stabilization system protein ParE
MALEIYWSKKASSKFDKILEYLENKFGNQTTVKFVKKVFEFLDLLENFPNLGTLENEELGFVLL